jgi:hypothetical protein
MMSAAARHGFLLAAIALVLVACAIDSPAASDPRHCADLVARSMSSPDRPVAGSFGCYSKEIQATFRAYGATNEIALQRGAQLSPVYRSSRYLGSTANHGLLYELRGYHSDEVVVLWEGDDGRIEQVSSITKPEAAPPGLGGP